MDVVTGVAAPTHEAVMALTEKYHDLRLSDRVLRAGLDAQPDPAASNSTPARRTPEAYSRLAGSVVYASALRRGEGQRAGPPTAAGSPAFGATASPAIFRSSWFAFATTRASTLVHEAVRQRTPTGE